MASVTSPGPRISLSERDRRYGAIRERLRDRGVDAVLVTGTNLFYLTNGLPGERFGVLPTADIPITVVLNGRHLADVSPDVLANAQDWAKDLRGGNDAGQVIERLKELRLEKGTIGIGSSSGFSHRFYAQLTGALPGAKIVEASDIFDDIRTIKSEEEIAMIDRANILFDLAVERVHEVARPGMLGRQVVQEGIRAMWEAGADLDSSFGFTFGAIPHQNPILGALGMERPVQAGDIGTMTAHSEYRRYAGHSDQEISFGEPKPAYRDMFGAVLHVREAVLKEVKAGITQQDLIETYRKACTETGFRWSHHSQIHQYGIDVPEFPGPSFAVKDGGQSGRGDFVLQPGMIYSISPTVVAPNGDDTMLGGTSLVVTDTGYRELGDRKVELLVVR
jgi:Xaa-Pro aminopeptidase